MFNSPAELLADEVICGAPFRIDPMADQIAIEAGDSIHNCRLSLSDGQIVVQSFFKAMTRLEDGIEHELSWMKRPKISRSPRSHKLSWRLAVDGRFDNPYAIVVPGQPLLEKPSAVIDQNGRINNQPSLERILSIAKALQVPGYSRSAMPPFEQALY